MIVIPVFLLCIMYYEFNDLMITQLAHQASY